MNEQPKPRSAEKGDRIFDQFAFGDIYQNDVIFSGRAMQVMRYLRKHGSTTEGLLANALCEKSFLPDWKALVNKLVDFEFIKVEPTGRGAFRKMTLTDEGEQFLVLKLDPPKPVEQVGPKPGEEFEKTYLEVTGKPLFPTE